jgi:hypothetical protein
VSVDPLYGQTSSEFGHYTGDCVWKAVQDGAHKRAPRHWPETFPLLNSLTTQAIAAGIGVGSEGQATAGQLEHMLGVWGMRYTNLGSLSALDGALARGASVLIGYSNGQALPGDEPHLFGHENCVLHKVPGGYLVGDGDNPACYGGQPVFYTLAELEAAQADSFYALEEVPGQMLQISETSDQYVQKPGQPADAVWTCTVAGHQFDVQHGILDYYRLISPILGNPLALPNENLRQVGPNEYEQRYTLFTAHWKAGNAYLVPVATGTDEAEPDLAGIRADAATIQVQAQDIIKKAGG